MDAKDQEIIILRRKIAELEAELTDYQDKTKTDEKPEEDVIDESEINEDEFHDFDEEIKQEESCEEVYKRIFEKEVQFDQQVR